MIELELGRRVVVILDHPLVLKMFGHVVSDSVGKDDQYSLAFSDVVILGELQSIVENSA